MDRFKRSLELNNRITLKDESGFFRLEFDAQAIDEFENYVNENYALKLTGFARIKWLVDHNFYSEALLKNYTREQVEEICNLTYSYRFKFASFMAIKKFYDSYALRTDDKKKFLEKYEDRIISCALFLADGDFVFAKNLAKILIEQKYQPSTPTFANAGKKRSGELVSCFLLDMDDSINSIGYILSTSMQLSKIGGGVAINLTRLRARGASIKDIAAVSSGVIPVMKILEDVFDYADQLGQRRGAGAVFLSIFHMDVIDFLDSKKINADEKSRIQTLSLGLIVPDKFFELCVQGVDYCLFEPHTVFKKYGINMADMDMNH